MINRRRVMTTGDHEYVDLGLPSGTLWATMNVGATSETDYGNYYKYGSGATAGATNTTYYMGNENQLSSSVDTARQVWGGEWHMPTKRQCGELIDYTYHAWTSINGVRGGIFKNKTDTSKYIFLPAAGLLVNGSFQNVGSDGYYWTSSSYNNKKAYYLYCSDDPNVFGYLERNFGFPVRPVIG